MPKKEYLDNPDEFKEEAVASHPPSFNEGIGAEEETPAPPTKLDDAAKEKARYERLGVKSDDDAVRAQNVLAEAPHVPDPLNLPMEEKSAAMGEGEYKINNYGHTVPAQTLAPSGSTPTPAQPVVPVPPVVVVPEKK